MFSKSILALTIFALTVAAQESPTTSAPATTPTPAVSACILSCVGPAATAAGCSSPADLPCVCTSAQFQTAAGQCLRDNCTSEEQSAALSLQSQQCAAFTTSATTETTATSSTFSGSQTTTTTSPASSSHTSTTTTSTHTPTQTGAAKGLKLDTGFVGAALLGLLGVAL